MVSIVNDKSEIPYYVLDKASQDKFLPGLLQLDKGIRRILIRHEGMPAGFYTPKQSTYEGVKYWRTGPIYILPEYRGKGLATKIITEFFKNKEYGLAYVNCNNAASVSCFTKAGLIKVTIGKGNLFVFLKKPGLVEAPKFLNW
jgi:GNAT superfamily N-acetyltransferase